MRKTYSPGYKAKIAIEAIKEEETMAELSSRFGVHRAQIQRWKNEALTGLPNLFEKGIKNTDAKHQKTIDLLYQQIGQLKVENDWLKKRQTLSVDEKRILIDHSHPDLSISRQCELIGLSKGALYYQPVGTWLALCQPTIYSAS